MRHWCTRLSPPNTDTNEFTDGRAVLGRLEFDKLHVDLLFADLRVLFDDAHIGGEPEFGLDLRGVQPRFRSLTGAVLYLPAGSSRPQIFPSGDFTFNSCGADFRIRFPHARFPSSGI